MHLDHEAWRSEGALWHDQLREWESQTAQAVADLDAVRKILTDHERALEKHAAGVHLFEGACAEHEHELAVSVTAAPPVKPTVDHRTEASNHAHQRELHEALKHRHHSLIARWNMLMGSLKIDN
jgi:hypothetical protein